MGIKKPATPISTETALDRITSIVPMLATDVRIALAVYATMEAGNKIIAERLGDRPRPGADTFNLIQNSLTMRLAIEVAKIYDHTKAFPLDAQDKASIPVLAHHLSRSDVRAVMIGRARGWMPRFPGMEASHAEACSKALDIVTGWRLQLGEAGVAALARVRDLRNRRLAHSLFDRDPEPLPRYQDLFDLLQHAREVTEAALAVLGEPADLTSDQEVADDHAERFWSIVFAALQNAE